MTKDCDGDQVVVEEGATFLVICGSFLVMILQCLRFFWVICSAVSVE